VIVASDLEGTLTTSATWKAVGRWLNVNGYAAVYRRFFAVRIPTFVGTKIGLVDDQAFKEEWVGDLVRFFKDCTTERFEEIASYIVEEHLWPARRMDVVNELRDHVKAGHRVIIASGAYQPVVSLFAQRIGSDEAIGTPVEVFNGQLTGRIAGDFNTGQEKIRRLQRQLKGGVLDLAYGDTMADVPMFERAVNPVAVYPTPELRRVAKERGWRILDAT